MLLGGGGGGVLNCTVDHILQEFCILFLTRFRTYKIASTPQTKLANKDDIKGLESSFVYVFRGSFGAAKFVTCMLSLILSSAVSSKHAEHTHQQLMLTLSKRVRN